MSGELINLALFALIVGMIFYQGRLYLLHRLAFRLAFLGFWLLLGTQLFMDDRWPLLPALACLIYGIWRRNRLGHDLDQLLGGDGSAGEAKL